MISDCDDNVLDDQWDVAILGDEFKVEMSQTGTSFPNLKTTFRLINSSSHSICGLFVEEDEPTDHPFPWGSVLRDPLYPGTEYTYEFYPGIYRFRISDCDDNVLDEQWGVEFVAREEFRWEISH